MFLERNLLEEQLLSSDLKKKLHNANRQNGVFLLRIRKLEKELNKSSSAGMLGVLLGDQVNCCY